MPNTDLAIRGARMDDLEGNFSIEEKSFPDLISKGVLKASSSCQVHTWWRRPRARSWVTL